MIAISGAAFYFLLPPQVIHSNPSNQAKNIAVNSSLVIKFDKPVKRQKLQPSIYPEAYGEWEFKDSLIKNHLFRTLTFKPALELTPDTQYQVRIENIVGTLGINYSNNFAFTFTTEPKKENSLLSLNPPKQNPEPEITLLDIPLDWQDYPLSCEAASLKMALTYKGVYVSEDEVMEKIGYDLTPHKDNIWGNPYEAFVGNIKGQICQTGYGVYWQPVAKAANNWREAEAFSQSNLEDLLKEIQLGNPVIVWGTLPIDSIHDCSWYSPSGEYIKAYKETHVRLVVGFVGSLENPSKIIINDPLSGVLYWDPSFFLTNWKTYGYSGVVIR